MATTESINLHKNGKRKVLLIFITLFAAVGLYFLVQSSAASRTTSGATTSTAVNLYLKPSSISVNNGSQAVFEVRMNTQGKNVNAVNAEISYPVDKMQFVSIDATMSPLDFKLNEQGANGVIKIARGTTSYVTGDVLIGKVTMKATASRTKGQMTFLSQSAIVDAANATNILEQTFGSNITFKR